MAGVQATSPAAFAFWRHSKGFDSLSAYEGVDKNNINYLNLVWNISTE